MALALQEHRPHRTNAAMACHLLELLDGIANSSETKRYAKLTSDFSKPEPLTGNEKF
jgi:hypothetical protein